MSVEVECRLVWPREVAQLQQEVHGLGVVQHDGVVQNIEAVAIHPTHELLLRDQSKDVVQDLVGLAILHSLEETAHHLFPHRRCRHGLSTDKTETSIARHCACSSVVFTCNSSQLLVHLQGELLIELLIMSNIKFCMPLKG